MRTLLIVDDEPSILETSRFILEAEGYRVLTASNGEEALEVLRLERPPVVVLDVMMPRMNGYDVCREIRRDPDISGTYVFVLTARGQKADELTALEAGADAYMRKPFDEDDIFTRLDEAYATVEGRS